MHINADFIAQYFHSKNCAIKSALICICSYFCDNFKEYYYKKHQKARDRAENRYERITFRNKHIG